MASTCALAQEKTISSPRLGVWRIVVEVYGSKVLL